MSPLVSSGLEDQGFHDGPQLVADEVSHKKSGTKNGSETAKTHLT